MRNTRAKKLKKEVFIALYGDVEGKHPKEDIKAAYASSEFKAMYRARKKNYMKEKRFT